MEGSECPPRRYATPEAIRTFLQDDILPQIEGSNRSGLFLSKLAVEL